MINFQQFYSNPVIWVILLTALMSYCILFELLLKSNKDQRWRVNVESWQHTLQVMLNCLPLLGLFGTIVGLLQTFSQMSQGSMDQQELLSSGISDALLTTQVGLLMVIPGWVLLSYLKQIFSRSSAIALLQDEETTCAQN